MTNIPIHLANPRGFCAGVQRAIEIVNNALEQFGRPIYVRHEVVHNKSVVENLKEKGAVFVQDLAEVPNGSYLIFSAHGVSLQIRSEAEEKGLTIFDATCPLVTKVHMQVAKFAKQNKDLILIGHAGHPEVEGTLGQYKPAGSGCSYLVETIEDAHNISVKNPENVAYVTQTTLSVDDTLEITKVLQERFPKIDAPKKEDICYATQNRQNAIKELCKTSDLILVVGSINSSNSNRLAELASKLGTPAYLIDNANEIDPQWLNGKASVGISSGASAPERLVREVIRHLESNFQMRAVSDLNRIDENVKFPLPNDLRE
jgi:4-hydroxy-3-methylbut-2-en-1-yl diphosphate reductase